MNAGFYFNNDGSVGIGNVPRVKLHINTAQAHSFGCGEPFEFGGFVPGDPLVLMPEGGVCRVETTRRRQRCTFCGQISWRDETIKCENCQSQDFVDVT